jgi:hypothetical protein
MRTLSVLLFSILSWNVAHADCNLPTTPDDLLNFHEFSLCSNTSIETAYNILFAELSKTVDNTNDQLRLEKIQDQFDIVASLKAERGNNSLDAK